MDRADPASLRAALHDLDAAVSIVPPALIPAFVAGLPASLEPVMILASARCYTRFPDARAAAVCQGEEAFARGENDVQRVAEIVRRFGIVPLPLGGAA